MKLLFVSDTQLGSGAAYGTAQVPRLADQAQTLELIAIVAATQGVTDVVFCGDAFQHRKPGVDELLVFQRWLDSLSCEVLMLAGNHDIRGPALPSVLELFGDATFTRPGVQRVLGTWAENPDAGRMAVVLAFLPWAHPGPLRAVRSADARSGPQEQAAALVEIAAGLRAQAQELAPEAMPILVTHFALTGMSLPTGLSTGELIGEPVLDSHALGAQGWRYVFAGHVHKPFAIGANGAELVSVGSPWVQDFGEAETGHGVWILDVAADRLEHVPLADRPFVTLDWEGLDGFDAYMDAGALDGRLAGAVVRLRWKLTQEEAERVDVEDVKRVLYRHGAHKVYTVQLDVERRARARAEGMAEDTEPLAALDAWLAATSVPEEEAESLRELTRYLLAPQIVIETEESHA